MLCSNGVHKHVQALSYIRESASLHGDDPTALYAGDPSYVDGPVRSHLAGEVEEWASGRDRKRQKLPVVSERLVFDDGGFTCRCHAWDNVAAR